MWISWWARAIYLTKSPHYIGFLSSSLPQPDCHFLIQSYGLLLELKSTNLGHSNFPGKLEKSGKIPVSRESKNLGKLTPLATTYSGRFPPKNFKGQELDHFQDWFIPPATHDHICPGLGPAHLHRVPGNAWDHLIVRCSLGTVNHGHSAGPVLRPELPDVLP